MKKFVSMLLSAAIGLTALTSVSVGGYEKKAAAADKGGMVLMGDSIAAGVTRNGKVEHNYGEICGDYLGCKVSNYAVSGHTTKDLIDDIDKLTAEQKQNVADAEYIVISVGGNDIMKYAAKKLVNYAVKKNFLNDGYTAENIPEEPSINEMMDIIKFKGEGSLMEFASKNYSNAAEINAQLMNVATDLRYAENGHEGYMQNVIMPNIKTAADKLKAISPNAKIMVQNIYQPVQLDPAYVTKTYGSNSNYPLVLNTVRARLEEVMGTFDEQLRLVDGIEVVDVKTLFTSGTPSKDAPGNAHYFVDIQTGKLGTADVHPNQKGHIAIATAILSNINKLHNDNGLLRKTFNGLSDKANYPAVALEVFNKVAGDEAIVTTAKPTTTTTTTTTTAKPTTTTTTSTTTTTKKPTTTTTTSTVTTTKQITTTAATTTTAPKYALGDVDNNKTINAIDASYILTDYAKTSTNQKSDFTETQKLAADVNKDKKINAVDASYVLTYYAYYSTGGRKSLEEYFNISTSSGDKELTAA